MEDLKQVEDSLRAATAQARRCQEMVQVALARQSHSVPNATTFAEQARGATLCCGWTLYGPRLKVMAASVCYQISCAALWHVPGNVVRGPKPACSLPWHAMLAVCAKLHARVRTLETALSRSQTVDRLMRQLSEPRQD